MPLFQAVIYDRLGLSGLLAFYGISNTYDTIANFLLIITVKSSLDNRQLGFIRQSDSYFIAG